MLRLQLASLKKRLGALRLRLRNSSTGTGTHIFDIFQVLNEKQHEMAAHNEYNFDHPDAFDFELLHQTLLRLKDMRKVEVPIYNFVTHRQANHKTHLSVIQCC
jgi:uridine kinase